MHDTTGNEIGLETHNLTDPESISEAEQVH